MKQFVKALNKKGTCFKYIQEKFPYMSVEKVEEGVLAGPQIAKLTNDAQFLSNMMDVEKKHNFLLQEYYQNFLATLKILTTKPLLRTCWLVSKHLMTLKFESSLFTCTLKTIFHKTRVR